MPNMYVNDTTANSIADDLAALPDAGSGAGYIELRTGASPGASTTATGTLLAELDLNDPSFSVSAEVATIQTGTDIEDTSANATGTAGYARFYDSDDNECFDLTVGTTGSGAGLELSSTSITSGQTVTVTGGTFTIPTGP